MYQVAVTLLILMYLDCLFRFAMPRLLQMRFNACWKLLNVVVKWVRLDGLLRSVRLLLKA